MLVTAGLLLGIGVVMRPHFGLRLHRSSTAVDEQRFLAAVHAELRAGASLRWALADAAAAQDSPILAATRRLAAAGAPIQEVADVLRSLPVNGRRLATAIEVVAISGGRSANLFLRLADRAAADADLARQRRTLTTQARMSALVVGGMPILWMAFGGLGRLQLLVESGAAAVAVVGVMLEGVGVLLVWRMAVS